MSELQDYIFECGRKCVKGCVEVARELLQANRENDLQQSIVKQMLECPGLVDDLVKQTSTSVRS